MGSCKGIENYSRHFDGRKACENRTALHYFPDDFLSYHRREPPDYPAAAWMRMRPFEEGDPGGDGFRVPRSAQTRPKFHEFEQYMRQVVFVSATPGPYELRHSTQVVEKGTLCQPALLIGSRSPAKSRPQGPRCDKRGEKDH